MAQKSIKALHEKLDAEISTHKQAIEALNKLTDVVSRSEVIIQELHEAETKKHQWYDEQIENKRQLSKEIQEGWDKEMGRLEELCEKESKL